MRDTPAHFPQQQPVPPRALALAIVSLAIPVGAAFWLPDWASNGLGTLIWLTALIPAFLLSYYRGLPGVAVALAGGMAVITATQVSIVAFDISHPDWPLLGGIVGVYLVVAVGIGVLAEVLRLERRAAEAMALMDRLTGLPNRRHADLVLEQEFAAAARGRGLTVVIYDLDRFKSINDHHGHIAGDAAIRAFAQVLRAQTRRENLSARFGGEEFISILRETTVDDAVSIAQRVLSQTRELRLPSGRLTVSAGVAAYEDGMGTYELLLGAADRALYRAKESGRDAVCVAPRHERVAGVPPGQLAVAAPEPRTEGAAEGAAAGGATAPVTVYVVDDDAQVLSVVKRMLAGRGMEIWGTTDAGEAIRRFTESPPAQRPALIITDVIMPAMTGMRMMEQIVQVSPGVRVIYMSGFVHGDVSWSGMPGSVVAVLEKPISPERIRTVVDDVLRAGPK